MSKEQVLEWLMLCGRDWVDGFTVYRRVQAALEHTEDRGNYNITKWHEAGYVAMTQERLHVDMNLSFKLTDKALKLLEDA
jgi:hypothetical protein